MKAFLMYRDQDLELAQVLPPNKGDLIQDLELSTLFNAMALGDKYISEVVKNVILAGLSDLDMIYYRQDILRDCLKNPSIIREIYEIPIESMVNKKKQWMGIFSSSPSGILSSAVEMMEMFTSLLRRLKDITDQHADKFESEGFTAFFSMIKKELDEDFFTSVQTQLKELKFNRGVLLSADLGQGNESTNYVLRKPVNDHRSWIEQIFKDRSPVYTFNIHPRDEHGSRALGELRDIGINLVANALAQSTDHIDSYFTMLRTELAFYIGCLNLAEWLDQIHAPLSFPFPISSNERKHSFRELYDISLALTMKQKVVGNNVNADEKDLVIITGANQGGKSTFLRSIGIAQLMLECGMFVPAESFRANVCTGLFTHYKREEDTTMKSGKLDEELSRMSDIVDNLVPDSMILFNESFAATNEREGSEIARQIICALLDKNIKVFFVTHLFDFAHSFHGKRMENTIFLRAERQFDGTRTFQLIEGEPFQTSFGQDVYEQVFGTGK